MANHSTTNPAANLSKSPASESSNSLGRVKGTSRYEIAGCLGRGGMGVVYEAFDRQRQERVALKTLSHFDPAGLYLFKQEFRTLADVSHPNLVHLHELVANEHDEVFFTMELVEGSDFVRYVHGAGMSRDEREACTLSTGVWREAIDDAGRGETAAIPSERRRSPANFDRLRAALRQLVEGVSALHDAGMLHRDLKPSNVRVTPEGRVVVLDFGVATELRRRGGVSEDEVVGTITYMAPEQATDEAPVAASDWYSVGAMVYEAIVGRAPFLGTDVEVLSLKFMSTPEAPSASVDGVPADLEALCMALLVHQPAQRPSARDILASLGAAPGEKEPPRLVSDAPRPSELVGREAQLTELRAAFESTCEGRAVTVHVSGLSGLGKSVVVNSFLDVLEQRQDVLVLRGRAYEREAIPYKAVDSVIDALSRHLIEEQKRGGSQALPSEIGALARVFPVLRRVECVEEIPQAAIGDPQVLRQRAFRVLREAFASLSQRQHVVVFIDDVQWGDTDSATLLIEIMREPSAPPLLLVMTHRADEVDTSPFLSHLRSRWPEDAEVREIAVAPLAFDDSKRLALAFMALDPALADQTAEAIARESRGSPFLIEELARSVSARHRIAAGPAFWTPTSFTLDELLGDRTARLPDHARKLLELVAVGGRPLPVTTVAAAANTGALAPQLIALLRARRFVRVGLRDGVEMVEAIHDRVREIVVAHLSPETTRLHHGELARVLEANPDADPEALASHLLGAGDKERAAYHAERAADQAIAKLAFAQAARLLQLTVEMLAPSSPDARRLQRRVAEASEWAGLPENAARAYLVAAEGAPTLQRVDLERAAAAQLIAAGCIDEGAAMFRRVLAALGRPVPSSVVATVLWIVVYRIAALLLGRPKAVTRQLSAEDRVRLDAFYAAGRGLSVVDHLPANYVRARHFVEALRSGNRAHIVRATANHASALSALHRVEGKRERELFEMARRISLESDDKEGYALYQITYGACQFMRGHWRKSVETLDASSERLAAVRRWNANASVYAVYALVYLGDFREVRARTTRLVADAQQRGDHYTVVNLHASHPIAAWLAADDVDGARRHLREAMERWSKTRFLNQHWTAMLWEAEVELYVGEGALAWKRIGLEAGALKKSFLLDVHIVRAFTLFVRGRAAIATLGSLAHGEKRCRLDVARRAARALDKLALTWTAPLAAILSACIANASGDVRGAEQSLRRAAGLARIADMAIHAAAARRVLGVLIGGEEGRAIVADAEASMRSRGVRVPERYAGMLIPGTWTPTRAG